MKIDKKIKKNLKEYLLNVAPETALDGKESVQVISAGKLDDEEIGLIKAKFKELNWEKAVFEVDPEILAGVIIKVGSRQLDLSLSGSLSRLSNKLYEID